MKRTHIDGEAKPVPAALAALDLWLREKGLYRSSLCAPLATHQVQIARVFGGAGCLSKTQRQALEEFTEGHITAAMLEGKEEAPRETAKPAQRAEPEKAAEEHPLEVEGLESIDDFLKKFGGKLGVAAMKNLTRMMVSGKSESSRMQATLRALEIIHGKPAQHEEKENVEAPVEDAELMKTLRSIEARLMEWQTDELGNRLSDEFVDGTGI